MRKYGTLYGIGVGPGDPDLLTLKAVKTLARVGRVFTAASTKNEGSTAYDIAAPHIPAGCEVERLGFPMTRDEAALLAAWENNADRVAAYLESGRDAAFLTLGDSLLYSTFGYLLRTLGERHPAVPVVAVPGITSYQAAAARTATILVESGENLQIVSGVCDEAKLRTALHCADNLVILKAYRNLPMIRRVLAEAGLEQRSVFVTRVGQEGEQVVPLAEAPEKPHYFSLLLVKGTGD
ncbi:MAG: precorrin-2 C(20)-methyltransferase [Desulfovibrionaceae bacterium]